MKFFLLILSGTLCYFFFSCNSDSSAPLKEKVISKVSVPPDNEPENPLTNPTAAAPAPSSSGSNENTAELKLFLKLPVAGKSFTSGDTIEIVAGSSLTIEQIASARIMGNDKELCSLKLPELRCMWTSTGQTGTISIVAELIGDEAAKILSSPVKIVIFPKDRAAGTPLLTVDVNEVQRNIRELPIGINFNYFRDDNNNRPTAPTIQSVLRVSRPGFIRYPGGEKSDWYFWSKAPWNKPEPTSISWYKEALGSQDPLDFDEYITYIKEIGAHPFVVVGYDSFERTGKTKSEYLESAVAQVKYANITKKYAVNFWEIGNENWHNSTGTASNLATVVGEFSKAMKAVDPTIKIGASGNNLTWWRGFLPVIAKDIDFLTVSQYSCWQWGSYSYFINNDNIDLLSTANEAVRAIKEVTPTEAGRIKVVISEFNSKDYAAGGWGDGNDLGHALVNFELMGQIIKNSDILFGMQWNTRWVDGEKEDSLWYALGPKNEIKAVGWPLKLWGMFAKDTLVKTTTANPVYFYATYSKESKRLALFVLNKGLASRAVTIRLYNNIPDGTIKKFIFTGQSPEDSLPALKEEGAVSFVDNEITLTLEPLSVTILEK